MSVTGDTASAPLRAGFPICDTIGGLTAAFAVSAAFVEQRLTGKGRRIDVSLLESTLAAMGWIVSNYLNAGTIPRPIGNENFTAAPSGTFQTGSGLLNISANEQQQYEALCDLIGRPELKTDARFRERQSRKRNREALRGLIEDQLTARDAAEWERLLNEAGVPAGRVLGVHEILEQPQRQERGFVESLELARSDGKPLRVTRPGFRFDDEPSLPAALPALGAHTRAWLRRLEYADQEVEELARAGVISVTP